MVAFVHLAMQNIVLAGFLGFLLVIVPIIGIMAAHESERPHR
jgi:hypothetical protein